MCVLERAGCLLESLTLGNEEPNLNVKNESAVTENRSHLLCGVLLVWGAGLGYEKYSLPSLTGGSSVTQQRLGESTLV